MEFILYTNECEEGVGGIIIQHGRFMAYESKK